MRICLVSRELAPYAGGGIGTYVALMARALVESGHEVHVLTQAHPDLPPRNSDGVWLHAVALHEGLAARDVFPYFPQRYAMAVLESLQRLDAERPFELIEFAEFYGEGAHALRAKRTVGAFAKSVLAVRLHTPSVLVRELNGVARLEGEAAVIDVMERQSLEDADLVLSPTSSLLALARERFGPFRHEAVVPHPFRAEWAADLGHAKAQLPGRQRILYFGRLERRKGVQLLIPALEGLVRRGLDVELVLLGADTPTGPAETSMRRQLERLAGPALLRRVRFEPPRGRAELGAAIAEVTVCCFPSVWENFPNVCLEAMAVGRPVVASGAGGMGELIEDGRSGLLFPGGDVAGLEGALARVLENPALSTELVSGARARLATYCDPAQIIRTLEEAIPPVPSVSAGRGTDGASRSPRVSVIVPFFNLASTLPETLASIDAQTFRDLEVIVVDDGSTEPASVQLIERLEREGRVRVVRKRNGGLSSARNAGLREARGELVLPLDADDLIAPTFLEKTLRVLEAEPSLAWCTSFVEFFSGSKPAFAGGWIPLGHAPELMLVENLAGSCTALFRRERLEEIGGYDESLPSFEDWDAYCSLVERGHRGLVVPEFLFRYRIREGSLAHAMAPETRHALRARIIEKHPKLMTATTMRRMLAEAETHRCALELPPARHRIADQLNTAIKRIPGVHGLLRRALRR
jgi:glycosyltransferase involved in cell wall biosynthesis/GT2 family glycosyltransferase